MTGVHVQVSVAVDTHKIIFWRIVQMETYTRAEDDGDFDTKEKAQQQTIRGDYSVEVEDIESKGAALWFEYNL